MPADLIRAITPGTGSNGFDPIDLPTAHAYSATHLAIQSPLSQHEIEAIATREGWRAVRCSRVIFDVIELWIEGHFMLEVFTDEMQRDYAATSSIQQWRDVIGLLT